MDHKDALDDINQIRRIMDQTRRAIMASGTGYILIVWGAVWLLGFSARQFLASDTVNIVWAVLVVVGIVASIGLGRRYDSTVRGELSWRIGVFWVALFGYSFLWQHILSSALPEVLFIVTVVMFGYIVLGLWLGNFLVWLGFGVTGLALLGGYFSPAYFALWMAVLGGGALMGSGVYILTRWK
ncbi:MAG: hypothetical protein GKR89_35960 [Candidatus Latescibacteria bacterium]|nr:hypothetical protein [Candidatus Latescibacterota bacterium]